MAVSTLLFRFLTEVLLVLSRRREVRYLGVLPHGPSEEEVFIEGLLHLEFLHHILRKVRPRSHLGHFLHLLVVNVFEPALQLSELLGVVVQDRLLAECADVVVLQVVARAWVWAFFAGCVAFFIVGSDRTSVLDSLFSVALVTEYIFGSWYGLGLDFAVNLRLDVVASWANLQLGVV